MKLYLYFEICMGTLEKVEFISDCRVYNEAVVDVLGKRFYSVDGKTYFSNTLRKIEKIQE